jgi:hypothetical protein
MKRRLNDFELLDLLETDIGPRVEELESLIRAFRPRVEEIKSIIRAIRFELALRLDEQEEKDVRA